jgi:hypothetical protein
MMRILLSFCSMWLGALLLGTALRQVLPHTKGIVLTHRSTGHYLPFDRLAFWSCLLAAGVATLVLLVKAMRRDLGVC